MHNLHKIGGMVGDMLRAHAARCLLRLNAAVTARTMLDATFTKRRMQGGSAAIADAAKPFVAPPLTEARAATVAGPHVVDVGYAPKISKWAVISEPGHAREWRTFARNSPRNNDRLQA